ncbi:MAG: serine/threonine-protein kinase [Candidatus Oleimicrobiaceae bacterium]
METPNCLLRFKQEALNCLKLKHKNIVPSLATGEMADGVPFLVMEYLSGETVRDIINRRGMTPDLFSSIVASVADALAYAHAQGIVHRDIKPHNVKADGSGIFKIMDFGIARVLGEASPTLTGMVLGTPYYMAPEQALGHPVDPRTDIYAFGVMLHELVTLRVPSSGDAIEVLKKHIHYDLIPPRKVNPHLSPRIERAILRAMRKNPRERFSSALELK